MGAFDCLGFEAVLEVSERSAAAASLRLCPFPLALTRLLFDLFLVGLSSLSLDDSSFFEQAFAEGRLLVSSSLSLDGGGAFLGEALCFASSSLLMTMC